MSEAATPSGARSGAGVAGLFSDERLTRRAMDGDERAFTAIFRRYHQALYRFCLAIVGEPQDAQDALQNTMVKVLKALPGETRQIKLKPWLYRIAHNESIEVLRRRRGTVELDAELAAQGTGLAEEAGARERLRRLIADLDELPDRQRGALVMRELGGLDFADIGVALGTSSAVARQTVYEARLSLGQMEAGREMSCTMVTKALSDADGRVTRRRDIRAHLRGCSSCRRFSEELDSRHRDLAALAPLPAVAVSGLLSGILGAHGGSAGGGLAGMVGVASGKVLGTSAAVKSAATVAVVAAVGFSATQGDLVNVGLPGDGSSPPASGGAERPSAPTAPSAPASAGGAAAGVESAQSAKGRGDLGASRATAAKKARGDAAAVGQTEPSKVGTTTAPASRGASAEHPHGRGHEKQLPSAAEHGQQTASAHRGAGKSANKGANGRSAHPAKPADPPGRSGSGGEHAKSAPPKSQGQGAGDEPQASAPPPLANPPGSPASHAAEKP
jgi:RNA polymerase sigma factor (sigma-70 family)